LRIVLPIVWDEDPTNQKEERKLNDTYLGAGGWGRKHEEKREKKKLKMILPLGVMEKKKQKI
jgi:hypothetical protein